ncbi:MAG: antibiotic biosynthesis monooxygenase [Pseudonocardia sp. SCN 72-86]|nr:MAG: antibiotic biosynthesis monooxygenase [Pseudonocardia sp. SCN 72-86]
MTAIIVVATISPKPGQEQAVRDAVLAVVPKVHAEPGCELYALHETLGDSTDLVFVEKWASQEALEAHRIAAPLAELGEALKGKVAKRLEVVRLSAVPGGTAGQGAI